VEFYTNFSVNFAFIFSLVEILFIYLGDEKASLDDFTRAAELGSAFAKQQVLLSNPYAAACNQMLSKMLKQFSSSS